MIIFVYFTNNNSQRKTNSPINSFVCLFVFQPKNKRKIVTIFSKFTFWKFAFTFAFLVCPTFRFTKQKQKNLLGPFRNIQTNKPNQTTTTTDHYRKKQNDDDGTRAVCVCECFSWWSNIINPHQKKKKKKEFNNNYCRESASILFFRFFSFWSIDDWSNGKSYNVQAVCVCKQ